MTQIGCVLVFKPGADPNEIIRLLKGLENVVDTTYHRSPVEQAPLSPKLGIKNLVTTRDGKESLTALHKFNPEHGGPVWYVP